MKKLQVKKGQVLKAITLVITVVMLTGALWFKVSAADATSIKGTIYSGFFTNVTTGKQVPARMIVNEHFQKLDCAATERPGYISCQFPTEYAGQQLNIEFTKNKVMFIYVVDVPKN